MRKRSGGAKRAAQRRAGLPGRIPARPEGRFGQLDTAGILGLVAHGSIFRRGAAFYLLSFFGLTFVTPHHHLNPIADLVSDGASDSGTVVMVDPVRDPGPGLAWSLSHRVEDSPCLACFWHDVTATGTNVFALALPALILVRLPAVEARNPLHAFLSSPSSRGPPSVASR